MNILVDTSVWIGFLQGKPGTGALPRLLAENQVLSHPWVFGELMLGHLGPGRRQILQDLRLLPQLPIYETEELCTFLEGEKIYGKGLSFVDFHLLYATLVEGCLLWSEDRLLDQMVRRYGRAYL